MTLRLQEIYGRFDLQTEISPPCLVNIKRFLYGFSESEKVCCCCFERNRDRIFFSETDQKFLQVLIVGGCRRKACIQCLLFLVCLCHDCCKRRFLKQMIGCFEILCSGLFECFDVLYFFEKFCSSFCLASIENGILYSPMLEVTQSQPVHTSPGCIPVPSAPYGRQTVVPEKRLLPGTSLRLEEVMYPFILSLSSVPR